MPPESPIPLPAPPARPRRMRAGAFAALVVIGLLYAATSDLARNAARWVGQRVAGVGPLEWRAPDGWTRIAEAATRRSNWRPDDAFLTPTWTALAPGFDLAELDFRRPPNPLEVRLVVARLDPDRWRFRVWGRPDFAPDSVAALAEAAGLSLAVNASYFSDAGPLGLVVSDGTIRGRQGRNRAAHFLVPVGGPPRIVNQRGAALPRLDQGFQGFPSIMSNGRTFPYMRHGGRGFDVEEVDRRSAACVLGDGRVLLLATDTVTNGLSLDELATVLGGLGCVDAMGFDGGSSTGLALRVGGVARAVANLEPVPVVLGVEPR